jgi:cell wall-associated NlpC family hydrolase
MILICCVSVSPMRAEPAHKSEMVSQFLFGECCALLETGKDQWIKVSSLFDGYNGWCQAGQFSEIPEKETTLLATKFTAEWVNQVEYNGTVMMVPLGCPLNKISNGKLSFGKSTVHFPGKVHDITTAEKTGETIVQLATPYLNTPYLWGGKSVFGIDCSGFVQNVFRAAGINLLRDAWQQAGQGEPVAQARDARCGDLAFFDNDQGKITHVGILTSDTGIIHASGKVRIDQWNRSGIIHAESGERTHTLKTIRRFF